MILADLPADSQFRLEMRRFRVLNSTGMSRRVEHYCCRMVPYLDGRVIRIRWAAVITSSHLPAWKEIE